MDYLNSLAMDPCNHRNPSKRKSNANKKSNKIKSKLQRIASERKAKISQEKKLKAKT